MNENPVCRNSAEIGAYIGIDKRSIPYYRTKYNLPVWRFEGKGNWKALKVSLNDWLVDMEKKQMNGANE